MTQFKLNGRSFTFDGPAMARLIDVVRCDAQLTGTKEGCGEGECGSCTVLINGVPMLSCLIPVCQVAEKSVVTVEGLANEDDSLQPVQRCFITEGGAQCGICTPGFLMAATALLETNPTPTRDEVKVALAGNLCRCTGYTKIIDAVMEAARDR
jgi:carbon-monoxide dehydrogenase small subunit